MPSLIFPVVVFVRVNVILSNVHCPTAYDVTVEFTDVPDDGTHATCDSAGVALPPLYVGTFRVYVPAGSVTV